MSLAVIVGLVFVIGIALMGLMSVRAHAKQQTKPAGTDEGTLASSVAQALNLASSLIARPRQVFVLGWGTVVIGDDVLTKRRGREVIATVVGFRGKRFVLRHWDGTFVRRSPSRITSPLALVS